MPPVILPRPSFAHLRLLPRISSIAPSLLDRIPHAQPVHTLSTRLHRRIATAATALLKRQSTTAVIPTAYRVDGPAPAAVAGIVLGSVAGFILLILLLFFLTGRKPAFTIMGEQEQIVAVAPSSVPRHSGRVRRSRRSSRSERIVDMRERSPRRTTIVEEERRQRIMRPVVRPASRVPSSVASERIVSERIVDERRETRPPPPQSPPSAPSTAPPPIRRVEGDDIVEVIEDGSSITTDPPPRRERRGSRRSSGYRSVDPNQFAGGGYPQIPIDRRRH